MARPIIVDNVDGALKGKHFGGINSYIMTVKGVQVPLVMEVLSVIRDADELPKRDGDGNVYSITFYNKRTIFTANAYIASDETAAKALELFDTLVVKGNVATFASNQEGRTFPDIEFTDATRSAQGGGTRKNYIVRGIEKSHIFTDFKRWTVALVNYDTNFGTEIAG